MKDVYKDIIIAIVSYPIYLWGMIINLTIAIIGVIFNPFYLVFLRMKGEPTMKYELYDIFVDKKLRMK